MAFGGRWWEVPELEVGTGGRACDGAIGSANMDAGSRGVAAVDGGVLDEVDARGSGVCYASVVD